MIEQLWQNQIVFFTALFVQYIIAFEFQGWLKAKKLARPYFLVFIVQDWIMNLIMTAWFLDAPAKWNEVVTERMKRYKKNYGAGTYNLLEAWRYKFAQIICRVLNVFDPGHC